jgi:hypothetical protein
VDLGVFEQLQQVEFIGGPFLSLLDLIAASFPTQHAFFSDMADQIRFANGKRPKRAKADRSRILKLFEDRRDSFSKLCQDELDAIEMDEAVIDDSCLCCRCHEAINLVSDIYGICCTGVNIELCPHLFHQSCYRGYCPICRTQAPIFIPVLLPGFGEAHKAAAVGAVKQLQSLSVYLKQMGQLLDFNNSSEMPKPFVQMIQTVVFACSELNARDLANDSLRSFASQLPTVGSQSDFEKLCLAVWGQVPAEQRKSAQILWNCFSLFGDNQSKLGLFDLTLVHAPPPDLYLLRLPERFTDFFRKDFGADEILALAGHDTVFRCLVCGKALVYGDGPNCLFVHRAVCQGPMMILWGAKATRIFRYSMRIIFYPPLYLSRHGDEDLGLRLGMPLYLSHTRRDELVRQLLSQSILTERFENE